MAGCWPVDEGGAARMCTFTIALEALAGGGRGEPSLLLVPRISLSFSCITYCIVPPPGKPTHSDFLYYRRILKMV